MPITRVQLETYLVGPDGLSGQRGEVCAFLPLYPPGTVPGVVPIPALSGPITSAMAGLGLYPADPTNPATADLSATTPDQWDFLSRVADYRLLRLLLGNWRRPNQTVNNKAQSWGMLKADMQAEALAILAELKAEFAYGVQLPSFGTVDTGFAATRCYSDLDAAPDWSIGSF